MPSAEVASYKPTSQELILRLARTARGSSRKRSIATPLDGGEENGSAIPFATARGMHFFELGVGHSTVIRVAAVVPLISCKAVPTPTRSKKGGQSLRAKSPL